MILLNPTHFETICIDTLISELLRIWIIYLFSSPRKLGMRCFHLFPISRASRCPDLKINVPDKRRLYLDDHLILGQELVLTRVHHQVPVLKVIDLLECETAFSGLNVIIEV